MKRKYASVADIAGISSAADAVPYHTVAGPMHQEEAVSQPSTTSATDSDSDSAAISQSSEAQDQSQFSNGPSPEKSSSFPTASFSRRLNQSLHKDELTIQSIARSRLAEFSLRYADQNDHISLDTRIHRLLREGRIIEATQNFLDLYISSSEFSRESRREAAVTLFYANLQDDNISLAKAIFEGLEEHFAVTPAIWELMLLALGKAGRTEAIAELYTSYEHTFNLPKTLSVLVIRALLDTYRIEDAKKFALRYIYRDDDCAISGLYLLGIWKTSRKIEVVEAQFKQLIDTFRRRRQQVAEKLFEPMLKAYIEAGHEEQAAELIRAMTNDFGVPPGLRTMGLIAYSKALECDWDAVEADIKAIYASGVADLHPHKFNKIFHRIFLEYSVANSGKRIFNFVMMGVDECGIQPDQVLFDQIIKTLIERGTEEMINTIIKIARAKNWHVKIDKHALADKVRTSRLSIELAGYGLWNMYRAQKQKQSYASLSNRVLGYDITHIPFDEAYQLPWNHQPVRWWKNAMRLRDPRKPLNQFLPLHAQMLHFIQVGKTSQALELYHLAKSSGFVVKRMHVELAMSASIVEEEGIRGAKEILNEEHTLRGFGFGAPVTPTYFQQIMDVQSNEITRADSLKLAVFGFYDLLERKMLPFRHNFVANVSSELIRRHDAELALELLRTVCRSKYGAMVPFDDATVRILVRGFALAGNLRGLRWAILTAMSRPEILTRPLITELLRALEGLRLTKPGDPTNTTETMFAIYLKHLTKLTDMLFVQYEARLPKYQREALQRQEPIETTSNGAPSPDNLAIMVSRNKTRVWGPTCSKQESLSPPSTPTGEDAEEIDAHKRQLQHLIVDMEDVQKDSQGFETILANWRERVELDKCLGGDGTWEVQTQDSEGSP